MTERTRVLKVGGILLGLVVAGLVAGSLVLRDRQFSPSPAEGTPTPVTADGTPTPATADVKAQVGQGYLHAWDVWADSLLRLDASRLPEVLTGRALETITNQVEEQAGKNQPVRIRAEHNYRIVMIDATTASVDDRYLGHNVRLDPETLEPIEKDPSKLVRKSFTMRMVDGTWKIAEIIEYSSA